MLSKGFLSDKGSELKITHTYGISVMHHSHIHMQWELYFCPENISQSAVINGESYVYKHPCAILTTPYSVHSMSCMETEGTDFERYVCYFGESTAEALGNTYLPNEILNAQRGILFELNDNQTSYLKSVFEIMTDDIYPHTKHQKELLFGFIVNKLFDFCDESKITRVGETSFYIQGVLRYISENMATPEDAEAIAKHFAVSRSKLDRDFKAAIGMTIHDFSDICRLNYAKVLLGSNKTYSIAKITEACGLKNETYFYAFFKKHTGMSPSEYRKNKNNIFDNKSFDNKSKEKDFDPCGQY